jgi:cell division protease FtsH
MNTRVKTIIFWLFVAIAATLLWQVVRSTHENEAIPEISYSTFMSDVEAGNVVKVTITGEQIRGWYRDGKEFRLTGPSSPGAYLTALHDKGIEIVFREAQQASLPSQLLGTWAPLILLGALWYFMIRQLRKRQNPPGGSPSVGGNMGPPMGPQP